MSFVFRNRRFSPTALGSLLTLLGVALFLQLGLWQLERADEKRAVLAQFALGQESTAAATAESANSLPRYQHVEARGRYDSEHQILLDSMPSQQGRPGYRVLTPLHLQDGGWLLVDRGWVPPGPTRAELPQVAVGEAPRIVSGRLDHLPQPGIRLGENNEDARTSWPRVLNFPQREQLERALQRPLAHRILLLDPERPDGFERERSAPIRVGPGRHIAYAVQWFAFALLALVLYFIMSLKPRVNE